MRRYSEAVKTDIRKRMSPPARQSVARISEDTGINIATLYAWRKGWWLEGEVVPASQKNPEGWSAADKFTVVLESAGLNATELSAYCRVATHPKEPLLALGHRVHFRLPLLGLVLGGAGGIDDRGSKDGAFPEHHSPLAQHLAYG
ncbi:MAG: hypothetical protein ACODUE_09160 [Synechococcus sp.]